MKRALWLSFVLFTCISQCFANNILLAPSGTTLTTGQFRIETAFSKDNNRGNYSWAGVGFMQYELNLIRYQPKSGETENLLGAQWNFIPETIITPAISIGIRDAASQSVEGISGYAAITKHFPVRRLTPIIQSFGLTVGFGIGGIKGLFTGFETDLPLKVYIQAEYDSRDFNTAIGWRPLPKLSIKAYRLRGETYYGAEFLNTEF